MRSAVVLGLFVVLAVTNAHATPPANPNRAQARALYESANSHYNLSEYAEALKDFKEAYRLINDPVLLFNIAQCHRQLKELEDAARFYRAYRREYPDAPNRDEVDRLIVQMDEAIGQKHAAPLPPAPAPVVVTQPPSTVVAPAPPPRKKKKTWIWGVVAGVGVAVVVGVSVGVVVGGAKKDSTPQLPDVRF